MDSVIPMKSGIDKSYLLATENTTKEVVELMCYYNKDIDKNIVIANKQVVIRDMPIMHPLKRLPFEMRQFYYNPSSVW
jgi:hypothetical protein